MAESGRVRLERSGQGGCSLGPDLGGGAVVHAGWGVQPDAGVAVHVVVVIEERFAEHACVVDGSEAGRERRAVLQRLELGLGIRVVIRDRRPRVRACDAEIDEELGNRFGGHR